MFGRLLFLFLLGICLLFGHSLVTSYANGNETEVYDSTLQDAIEYSEEFGVDLKEAVKRLELMRNMSPNLEDQLRKTEPLSFAGIWFQHEPTFALVIASTNKNSALLDSIEINHAPAVLINHQHSISDLEYWRKEINELLTKALIVHRNRSF